MSDINDDNHRTRRRAVRSVGPPVEESAGAEKQPAYVAVAKSDAAKSDAVKSAAAAPTTGTGEADTVRVDGDAATAIPAAPTVDISKSEPRDAGEPASARKYAAPVGNESGAKRSVGRILLAAAAIVLVIGAVAGAVVSVLAVRSADHRDERRGEYVQTARQAVLNLTTIRADSAKEDIDRILSLASGQFKSEFDGRVDPFMSIVQQAKVVSNGEVVEAAIQSDDDDSAQVLVAAKQTLTNAGQAEPQTRYYRFRVTVTRSNGELTASKVEFVA
ncbi:hypothetical protein [Nocardia arizonensis]|uniref:hypothetical protein n=1 Tax=Nocardia arizonensis TaxID=1141647 RepID=UPI000AF61C0F|nr:hypothetical protein [Nocardia arizonensis]